MTAQDRVDLGIRKETARRVASDHTAALGSTNVTGYKLRYPTVVIFVAAHHISRHLD